MAWSCQATSHYLSQGWPILISPCSIDRPQRVYIHWYHYSISQEICTRFLLCCGYTLTDFPISIRLTSLALWQSNDCPSASKATLMNMDKYFMWIHYERLHNHNKAKHNKTVCIFLWIYCITFNAIVTDVLATNGTERYLWCIITDNFHTALLVWI